MCSFGAVSDEGVDVRLSFRMVLWLVTYYEFYDKKVHLTVGVALLAQDFEACICLSVCLCVSVCLSVCLCRWSLLCYAT